MVDDDSPVDHLSPRRSTAHPFAAAECACFPGAISADPRITVSLSAASLTVIMQRLSIFRAIHTIKGSSAVFGFDEVSRFTHHLENTLDAIRAGKRPMSADENCGAQGRCLMWDPPPLVGVLETAHLRTG
jgi:hypothetical protein